MNKKFSTLLVGLALTTAFSANAADPVDKQLHQLKVGGKYLSVTKSKVNTSADSLILVSEDKERFLQEIFMEVDERKH